jgi:multiple sugar transport system substrate-binding protein
MNMNKVFTDATGIKVTVEMVQSRDMAQKLQTTMAAGGQMPDIAWLEATYRGKLLSLNVWEDMSAAPYNYNKSNVLDYLIPLETAPNGQWIGPECPSVAGMAYKRELTLQYFGTDDPLELEKMFPDWNSFMKAGIEVQQKSGGKVFMLSSLGIVGNALKGQFAEPFLIGNKLNLEASMQPILDMLIQFKQNKTTDVLTFDTAEEGASYATNEHIFYPCANWSVNYTIVGNDRNGKGRWGFMIPPGGPFPWGGTVMGVPKTAKNKAAAIQYVEFIFGSEPGAIAQRDWKGNFSPFKPVYEQADFYSASNEYFAGQDVLKAIAQRVLPAIKTVRQPNIYDQDINDAYLAAITRINASDGRSITSAQLIEQMKDDLVNKQPAIQR